MTKEANGKSKMCCAVKIGFCPFEENSTRPRIQLAKMIDSMPVHPFRLSVLGILLAAFLGGCGTLPQPQVDPPAKSRNHLVVLDIDGTLTPHNLLVWKSRPDAARAVNDLASRGYAIVYITTRVPGFQSSLPSWLADHGFPRGPIHVASSTAERTDPAEFKSGVLKEYIDRGWHLAYAFGDSSTDFSAYQRAGLPSQRVFALKRWGRSSCQEGRYHRCFDEWSELLDSMAIASPGAE